jgi:WD40 repeat protein
MLPDIVVTGANFSPDGKLLLLSFGGQRHLGLGEGLAASFVSVRIWDVVSGTELSALSGPLAVDVTESYRVFLMDGKSMLLGNDKNPVRVWDVTTDKVVRSFDEESRGAFPLDVSPDGKLVLLMNGLRGLQVWDVDKGKIVRTLGPWPGNRACFSPDGAFVFGPAVVPERTMAHAMWDTATGELRRTFSGGDGWKYPLAFSPNDHLAVSGRSLSRQPGEKSTLMLWDWTTGQEVRVFEKREGGREGEPGYAQATAFSPDGKSVVTLDSDQMLRRWSVATGKIALEVPLADEHCMQYAITRDGRLALTAGGGDRDFRKGIRVKLWDTATGKVLKSLIRADDERLLPRTPIDNGPKGATTFSFGE